MWVRVWLPSLASLRIRIVSAEMLGGVFEGLRVPWKRLGGTLGASWAILEGLGVVLDAPGRRLGGVLGCPWGVFFSL